MSSEKLDTFEYDEKIVRNFLMATMLWGGIAFLAGLLAALQMASHHFNLELPWITFGRLRPLHTNAAIFAFAGNTIFAGIYYSVQRLCKTRMWNDTLSKIHFWGWQLIIVSAALTLPFGITQSKEYAELEWPIDILITLIWVVFGTNLIGTCVKRRVSHLYAAIWFYLATFVTVAVLHVVNSLEIPISFAQSYPVWAGAQDALVQWWYGHNAVAFFLTTPFLGLMYYFVPKTAERPMFSYRMSIVHFWSLVFIYIWAGPHHLLYTALPDWAQTLGMVFSLMLWAPSWAGMLNGLLTLRGVWYKVKEEPILKFFVAALTFYGMSTFEGPLLSIKSVSAIGHYTDWIIGHVHSGALGWNGLMSFGMVYYLVPRLYRTKLYSKNLATYHFWFALIGITLYVVSMWAAGITQGSMLLALDGDGKLLYPDFIETLVKIIPLYWVRALGGVLYIAGFTLLVYNVFKTIRLSGNQVEDVKVSFASEIRKKSSSWHRNLEAMPVVLTISAVLAILLGSVLEILPTFWAESYVPKTVKTIPYTPLELTGRDIYIKEGCYVCHSQMIRPLIGETLRYGEPSTLEESIYDRPFQWGSKRTGPDLARVGGKYPDMWHFSHMKDPRSTAPQSIMPAYPWLFKNKLKYSHLQRKLEVLKSFGVPYSDELINDPITSAQNQAKEIAEALKRDGNLKEDFSDKEIIALIAYLQKLGKNQEK